MPETAPRRVLEALGISESDRLGSGGEAAVYALSDGRVARVHHTGTPLAKAASRAALLSELAEGADQVPFAIPEVLDVAEIAGHCVSFETRLPGQLLSECLRQSTPAARVELIRSYLDAAACVGDLPLDRPWFGNLVGREPLRCATFREWLSSCAKENLAIGGPEFSTIDPERLAADLPEPSAPALVHMDLFPGNMLAEGTRITAVFDFGTLSVIGDRRLDP